ncbi:SufE family protein [Calidifontibacter terrae]
MTEIEELLSEAVSLSSRDRVQWLVELGDELPSADTTDEWVVVRECQSPVQVAVGQANGRARVAVQVPATAPLIRGVAALIVLGLDGQPIEDLPEDLVARLDLSHVVSPLRIAGLSGLWGRVRAGLQPEPGGPDHGNPR